MNLGRYYNLKNLKDIVKVCFNFVLKLVGICIDFVMKNVLNIFIKEKGDRFDVKNILFVFIDGVLFIGEWDKRKWIFFGLLINVLEVI